MLSGYVPRSLVNTWQFWRRGWDILLRKKWKKFLSKIHTTSQDANQGWCGTKSGSEHRKSSEVRSGNRLRSVCRTARILLRGQWSDRLETEEAILLTNRPTEMYQLAKDLVAPIVLREDSLMYDTIVEHLQKQLKPQKSALVARYELDNRGRNAGETVSQYVAVLKHLATVASWMMPCDWKGSEIDWFRVFEIREWCQSFWNSNSRNWHLTLL